MDMNDHKLLRKLLDDLGRGSLYDDEIWSLQLDSGMVAEVRFVEPATLPIDLGRTSTCKSLCIGGACPHDDGRCCEVCAHFNGGEMAFTCHSCIMLSCWKESALTDAEIEALMDDDIMPDDCLSCKHYACDVYDEPCNECTDEKYDAYINWEPKD